MDIPSQHRPFRGDNPASICLGKKYPILNRVPILECNAKATEGAVTMSTLHCCVYTLTHPQTCLLCSHRGSDLSIMHASFTKVLTKWSSCSKDTHDFLTSAGEGTPPFFTPWCFPDAFLIIPHVLPLRLCWDVVWVIGAMLLAGQEVGVGLCRWTSWKRWASVSLEK